MYTNRHAPLSRGDSAWCCRVIYEKLVVNDSLIYEYNAIARLLNNPGCGLIGADGLNWDFADDELSVLGYLSNSIPRKSSPVMFALRRFIDGIGMISVPTRAARLTMLHSALRTIVRSDKLVREFEQFLRAYGVDERLKVVDEPDGNPVLYFEHNRFVPFSQACSSGTLTLLMLFSRFHVRDNGKPLSFLYIDEFDAYLHFEVAEKLVAYFGSVDTCQTICSTHNTSLVRNVTMRPDCVFMISRIPSRDLRDSDFELLIKPLADRTDCEIRRINNVEHLLRNGEFS